MEEKEQVFEFTLKLIGRGGSEGEAWTDAVDSFCQDPGEPHRVEEILDVE